jgi:hypothetical protein
MTTKYEFEMRWKGGQRIILPIVRMDEYYLAQIDPDPKCVHVADASGHVIALAEKSTVTEKDVIGYLESLHQSDNASGFFYNGDPYEFFVREVSNIRERALDILDEYPNVLALVRQGRNMIGLTTGGWMWSKGFDGGETTVDTFEEAVVLAFENNSVIRSQLR